MLDHKRAPALALLAAILPLSLQAETSRLEAGFADPPREARPLGWWHWINGNVTKAGIKADLEAAKRAGMGGVQMFDVEIYMPPGPVRYGTARWFEHVRYAMQTAHRLGLEFHLMNTPGWSASGGPWVTPELSMKELVWSETETRGGTISLQVAQPDAKPASSPRHAVDLNFYEDIAVIAVPRTRARIDDIERKIGAAARPVSRLPGRAVPGIPAAAVIDLTAEMDERGGLQASLPAGDWVLLRFGYRSTGRGNHPAVAEGTGLEIDKLDAAAVTLQFQHAVGPILEQAGALAGDTFNGLLFDSFEAGFQTWSEHLPAEFGTRKGYDLRHWLPVLTGRILESRELSEAFLWDFRQVIEALLAENYFGVMQRLGAQHGLKIYSESQGGPLNPLSANRHVDVPMNEFWMPEATPRAALIKATVSAASLAGKGIVAAEAFTATPENGRYRNNLASLKRPGDQAFALGINRFALHSFTHQPVTEAAPGFALGRYGTHFGRLNTWWPYADGWIDYVSRSQFLLQQGRIVADVCLLVDEDLGYRIPSGAATKLPGYHSELCYPQAVREMTVRDGVLTHPSGAAFRLLVTPGTHIAKTWVAELSTLRRIRDLVRAGAQLAGDPPVAPAGLSDVRRKDEFNQLVEEIWGRRGDRMAAKRLGKGRVHAGASLLDILEELDVSPDLSWSPGEANLQFIHRRMADADIYFVFSDAATPVQARLQFRQKERRPEIWDALSGARVDAPMFSRTDDGISVPVQFGPRGSVFVVFRKPLPARWVTELSADWQLHAGKWLTRAESLSMSYSDGARERVTPGALPASEVMAGPWQVRFTDGRSAPDRAVFERLISWSEHPDPGIRYYSGTAIYETIFTAALPRHGSQVAMLDLGEVADVARVFVNGKEVDVLWTPPFRAEITPLLHDGRNTLAIHVANRWVNRLIGDEAIDVDYSYQKPGTSKFTDGRIEALPEWLSSRISEAPQARSVGPRHSFSVWKHYEADAPLVRSGLLGPVRIQWWRRLEPRR